MHIHRRRLKIGITSKVVLAMFLVVLTTILTIAFYSYTKSKNLAIEQVQLEMYTKAETVETKVTALFEQKGEIVRQLSIIPVIESFGLVNATRENAQSNKDYEWLQKALINAKNFNENIEMVWLANIVQSYFIAYHDYFSDESYSIKERPWYEAAINNKGLSYTLPYFDFATKKLTVSIIHPVTINNETFGFLGVDIHLDDLPGLLAPFESDGQHLIVILMKDMSYTIRKTCGQPYRMQIGYQKMYIRLKQRMASIILHFARLEILVENRYIYNRKRDYGILSRL